MKFADYLIIFTMLFIGFLIGIAVDLSNTPSKPIECGELTNTDFYWNRIPARCEKEIELFKNLQ